MLHKPILILDDYSGGFLASYPTFKDTKCSPYCLNVHNTIFKSLKRRNGYSKLNSSTQSATANGITNYVRSETVQYLVSLWGTTLKKMDVVTNAWDGTWDTISVSTHGTALSSNFIHTTIFNSDLIITTESRDVPQKYDPDDDVKYTDLDWETSHCHVTGDDATISTGTGAYLKITIDSTEFDDVDVRSKTTVAAVVTAINAHTGLSAKGYAYADSLGYLRIISNTRGSTGTVVVADGTSDTGNAQGEATEVLFSGTTVTGTAIGSNIAPSGKYCINWHDIAWIANTAANPDGLYRSANADHTTWTITDCETFVTPRDVGVTGLAVLHGRLYLFKKFSIHRITYIGGTPLLDIKQVKSWVGTASPRSIQNVDIPEQGEVLMYLGTDLQLYKFDGYNTVPIGAPILNYNDVSSYCLAGNGSTYGINPGYLANVHAVVYPQKHWYVLYFCLDNDTTPSDAFVYDYLNNCFWPFHFASAFTASCNADNGAGQRKVYVAGANYAWLFDNGNDDDDTAIDAYWDSMKISANAESYLKRARQMWLSTSSAAVTPSFASRVNWDTSYDTADTLVTSQNTHIIDVPKIGNLLQFRFSDNSKNAAFELYKMELMAQEIGGGV